WRSRLRVAHRFLPKWQELLGSLDAYLGHGLLNRWAVDGKNRLRAYDRVVHVAKTANGLHGAGVHHAVPAKTIVDVDADHLTEHHPVSALATFPGRRQRNRLPEFAFERGGALLNAGSLHQPTGNSGQLTDWEFVHPIRHRGGR